MSLVKKFSRLTSNFTKRSVLNSMLAICLGYCLPVSHSAAMAGSVLEYQVKAAFIYNFIAFTHWPNSTNNIIHLCIYGEDYFGNEIDKLQNRPVDKRKINVLRISNAEQLEDCQAIFFSNSGSYNLSSILSTLQNKPILTLADSSNAISHGITINMNLINEKIVFKINLAIARKSGLDFSSKLLQLAAKVY